MSVSINCVDFAPTSPPGLATGRRRHPVDRTRKSITAIDIRALWFGTRRQLDAWLFPLNGTVLGRHLAGKTFQNQRSGAGDLACRNFFAQRRKVFYTSIEVFVTSSDKSDAKKKSGSKFAFNFGVLLLC